MVRWCGDIRREGAAMNRFRSPVFFAMTGFEYVHGDTLSREWSEVGMVKWNGEMEW